MYQIHRGILKVEDYIALRQEVDFLAYPEEDVRIALENSLYKTSISYEGRTIGIGRVVGDGKIAFFLKDIVVLPEFQKKKVGEWLMRDLLDFISEVGAPKAYVGLMATPGTEKFYERFGFIRRPNESYGSGMVRFME